MEIHITLLGTIPYLHKNWNLSAYEIRSQDMVMGSESTSDSNLFSGVKLRP